MLSKRTKCRNAKFSRVLQLDNFSLSRLFLRFAPFEKRDESDKVKVAFFLVNLTTFLIASPHHTVTAIQQEK